MPKPPNSHSTTHLCIAVFSKACPTKFDKKQPPKQQCKNTIHWLLLGILLLLPFYETRLDTKIVHGEFQMEGIIKAWSSVAEVAAHTFP
jgi:hypothetical protein